MPQKWLPTDFCPRDCKCSMSNALQPSNGPAIQSIEPSNPDQEPMPSEIRDLTNVPPYSPERAGYKWERCTGQTLPIAENIEVFQMIGTKYGGDGRTTFGLPDLSSSKEAYSMCMNGAIPGFVGP